MKYYKLDRDTKAYLKRMAVDGIKTPADIYSVNDFVVGLKDLNLQDFTEAYFYSNLQNAGFGTVYSFRNNLNNGTISGTHNRRTDGIELIDTDGSGNSVINTNFLMPFAPCTFICIFRSPAQVNVTAPTIFYTAGVNFNGNQFAISSASLPDSRLSYAANGKNWSNTISSGFTSGSNKNLRFNVASFMMPDKRGPLRYGFNNAFLTGSSYVTADEGFNTTRQFYRIKGYNFSTTILHSALFFERNLSDSEVTNIYNLIKATSGKMLNIP
jgi:hypothetical protein